MFDQGLMFDVWYSGELQLLHQAPCICSSGTDHAKKGVIRMMSCTALVVVSHHN
jgi:hypothetical protein